MYVGRDTEFVMRRNSYRHFILANSPWADCHLFNTARCAACLICIGRELAYSIILRAGRCGLETLLDASRALTSDLPQQRFKQSRWRTAKWPRADQATPSCRTRSLAFPRHTP